MRLNSITGARVRDLIVPDVKKICVLRSNALGDFIFTLPALEALKSTYPAAELVIFGKKWHVDFLDRRPGPFDRTIAIPNVAGINEGPLDPEATERFLDEMRREEFDLAVQLYGGGKYSNPFIKRMRARVTIGMKADDACDLDRTAPYVYFHHEVLRFLEVVALAGAEPVTLEPQLAVTQEDLREALEFVPHVRRLVVLHPGATDPRRRWPPEKFAALGDALAGEGATIAINGVKEETALVNACVDGMKVKPLNLCGKLSLRGLAGLFSMSDLLVSNDTGPLHLARAVGTKTLGIYWVGNLINAGPLTLARHQYHVSWRLDCPECGTNCISSRCGHTASFVKDIASEEAIRSAKSLLKISP